MIEPERLRRLYLEPMRATVDYAAKAAEVSRPAVSPDDFEARMLGLAEAGKGEEASKALAETREQVLPHLRAVKEAFGGDPAADEYVKGWQERLSGMEYWAGRLKRFQVERARQAAAEAGRQAEDIRKIPLRFKQLATGDYSSLLAAAAAPPAGETLAEIKPADWTWKDAPPPCRGPWGIGRYPSGAAAECVLIAYPKQTPSQAGWYAEVRAEAAVPKSTGRLLLDAFINDDVVSTTRGYWFAQLWVNDKKVSDEDLALARAGKEWLTVDATAAAGGADTIRLRFRVIGKRRVSNYKLTALLGPLRLRAK